jgi:hypothetical protein
VKVDMIIPPPGRIPRKNPMTDPRRIGQIESIQSRKVGSTPLISLAMTSWIPFLSRLTSTSAIPKRPITMGTTPTPSIRVMLPKTKR